MEAYIDPFNMSLSNQNVGLDWHIELPDGFDMTKIVEEIQGLKQKENELGQKLYKTNVAVDEFGNETYDETIEEKMATEFEVQQVTSMWVDEEGIEHSETVSVEVPVEWVDNEPVMVDNVMQKAVGFSDNPAAFSLEEVMQKKYELIAQELGFEYAYADEFITEEDLDLTVAGHSANTGIKLLELLPNGLCQTKSILLDTPATEFVLYLEADANIAVELAGVGVFDTPKITLPQPVSEITVRFNETQNIKGKVNAYALFYR